MILSQRYYLVSIYLPFFSLLYILFCFSILCNFYFLKLLCQRNLKSSNFKLNQNNVFVPGFSFFICLVLFGQACSFTAVPKCVQQAFPDLVKSSNSPLARLGQIFGNELKKGDLGCKFCLTVMQDFNESVAFQNFEKLVRIVLNMFQDCCWAVVLNLLHCWSQWPIFPILCFTAFVPGQYHWLKFFPPLTYKLLRNGLYRFERLVVLVYWGSIKMVW